MHNFKMIGKMYREIAGLDKGILPVDFFCAILTGAKPFVNIWFTAKIIGMMTAGADFKGLLAYILAAVALNFVLDYTGGFLSDLYDVKSDLLFSRENFKMAEKLFRMDYEKLEEKVLNAIEQRVREKNDNVPAEIVRLVEKSVLLQELDALWKDHIATLDYMRHTIVLRAYGQKDPLNEYKKEAFNLFSDMLNQLGEKVTFILLRTVIQSNAADALQNQTPRHKKVQEIHENPESLVGGNAEGGEPEKAAPFQYRKGTVDPNDPSTWGKVARNDLCPCGSGKKYKHCHGQV